MLKHTLDFPEGSLFPCGKIVGGVVQYCNLVVKLKIIIFFSGLFVGDSRKSMFAKISRYTVVAVASIPMCLDNC